MHPFLELLYQGSLLGLISALSLGPVFFSILETSMRKGVYFAISIAVGVLISDAFIIAISFLSIAKLIQNPDVKDAIGTVGGFLLVGFGIYYMLKPIPHTRTIDVSKDYFLYMLKGFLLNTLNPFIFIYWLSAVSIVAVDMDYSETERILFFTVCIGVNFFFDILKSYFASKLRHFLTHKTMITISRAVGIGIMLFGLRLLWKTLIR